MILNKEYHFNFLNFIDEHLFWCYTDFSRRQYMVIEKFKKQKNGMYKIIFSNCQLEIHEDLILKYDLLLKKEITDELLLTLEKENLKYQAYYIAIRELQKRLRSEKELRDFLFKKEISNPDIDEVLSLLKEQGYLNDDVYLESYIHDRILLSMDGPLKIKRDLIDKGFSNEKIELKLSTFDSLLEEERVFKIIQKNLKQNRKSVSEFRLKMKQNLAQLGYHDTIILTSLEAISFDEGDLYQKEYNKLYRRLSSKYSGKELEYKIRQKLYQKGFRT